MEKQNDVCFLGKRRKSAELARTSIRAGAVSNTTTDAGAKTTRVANRPSESDSSDI